MDGEPVERTFESGEYVETATQITVPKSTLDTLGHPDHGQPATVKITTAASTADKQIHFAEQARSRRTTRMSVSTIPRPTASSTK